MTGASTVTIPSATTLKEGWRCWVQADGASVTLDGTGATNASLANGDLAMVYVANGKVKVSVTPAANITSLS